MRKFPRIVKLLGLLAVTFFWARPPIASATETRIKDIVDIEGERTNTVTGIGLVTGLNGTGSKSGTTRQIYANLLQRYDLRIDALLRTAIQNNSQLKTNNTSVVAVSAELPTHAKPGQRLDVLVSTLDDASNLQGGYLVVTNLLGPDGEVYARADGTVSTGGFNVSGDAASVSKNYPTTSRISNGAVVEKCIPILPQDPGSVRLLLRQADWQTIYRIAEAINARHPGTASIEGISSVHVQTPTHPDERAKFLAEVTSLRVQPAIEARVMINERTGTVVISEGVRLSRVAVAHGNLSVITGENPEVVQPAPFSDGQTTVVPRTEIDVIEEKNPIMMMESGTDVNDLVKALNALGVTPRDLSSIFQQLKEVGALHARLELQ